MTPPNAAKKPAEKPKRKNIEDSLMEALENSEE
jgi:hypothetical protein